MKRMLILILLLAVIVGGGALYFAHKAETMVPPEETISVKANNVGPY